MGRMYNTGFTVSAKGMRRPWIYGIQYWDFPIYNSDDGANILKYQV